MIFIEQAYDPTELRGDEDETFHQDDAARVSMNRMDMVVAIKELPAGGAGTGTYRELVIKKETQLKDVATATTTWSRPIQFSMRR